MDQTAAEGELLECAAFCAVLDCDVVVSVVAGVGVFVDCGGCD